MVLLKNSGGIEFLIATNGSNSGGVLFNSAIQLKNDLRFLMGTQVIFSEINFF